MTSPSHDEIRHRILTILHVHAERTPESFGLDRITIESLLDIPKNVVFFNMKYLEQKGLIQLFRVIGGWVSAQITAFGIDVVENKEKYGDQFPFMVQEIHGDIYGNVIQAFQSKISFSEQVALAFKEAHTVTYSKENVSGDLKKKINEHLDILEEELQKKEPDVGKIQGVWKWLKRNANWVVPILAQFVLEGVKSALG